MPDKYLDQQVPRSSCMVHRQVQPRWRYGDGKLDFLKLMMLFGTPDISHKAWTLQEQPDAVLEIYPEASHHREGH